MSSSLIICSIIFILQLVSNIGYANPDAKRLYDDLLNGYNSMIRPVGNNSDIVIVKMALRLSQLIDVNLKNQIMTTNMWVEQEWIDYKLKWEPDEYGGVTKLHVPAEQIWLPDLVLYNNADGNYEITILTKAILHHDGHVIWKPPAIYKSSCEIDIEYFPFDEQTCTMKFGSWTYDGYTIDLRHKNEKDDEPVIPMGMDLSAFYLSVEWDIMAVPAKRKAIFYNCCIEPFIDITFNITLRRKTLFYTFNLIIPCVAISFLSILVFYLPSDSGEKVSLSISIMLSLVVFFLLLAEIIPPTSLAVPLLGKYLLFTMTLITFSIVATIAVENINYRSPATHRMAPFIRAVFINFLPKYLFMVRPKIDDDEDETENEQGDQHQLLDSAQDQYSCNFENQLINMRSTSNGNGLHCRRCSFNSMDSAEYVAEMMKSCEEEDEMEASGSGVGQYMAGDHPHHHHHHHPHIHHQHPLQHHHHHHQLPDHEVTSEDNNGVVVNGGSSYDSQASMGQIGDELRKLTTRIQFLSHHKKNLDSYLAVEEDWKYVAMVLDRLFLWIFTIFCIGGACLIILRAPLLYNFQQPIDILLTKVNQ